MDKAAMSNDALTKLFPARVIFTFRTTAMLAFALTCPKSRNFREMRRAGYPSFAPAAILQLCLSLFLSWLLHRRLSEH
jgi:hypothetical protein